jgi:hypothetical protein
MVLAEDLVPRGFKGFVDPCNADVSEYPAELWPEFESFVQLLAETSASSLDREDGTKQSKRTK